MSVYVLTMDWHYETHLVGVFSSREKALNEIKVQQNNPSTDNSTMRFDITEMEVQ